MFEVKRKLTNVRPAKSQETVLVVTPNTGNLKLTQPTTQALGLQVGDYLDFAEGTVDDASVFAIAKGKKGEGAKLGVVGENTHSGVLAFGSRNVWEALKGDTSKRLIYSVDTENSMDVTDEKTGETKTWYKITFKRSENKTERKGKGTTSDSEVGVSED